MRCLAKATNVLLCLLFASILGAPTALNAAEKPKASSSLDLSANADPAQVDVAKRDAAQSRAAQNYGDLPLSFEENRGQSDQRVRFLSRGAGYTFFLTPGEAVLAFSQGQDPVPSHPAVLRLQLAGSNADAHISGVDPLPGSSNYFLGQDPAKWRNGVPTYRKVAYENIYPGINLVYYGNQRQLEYDFVVAPGADPSMIRLAVEGAGQLTVDAQGNLVLGATGGEVRLLAPKIYQDFDGRKREIAGQWNLDGKSTAGFRLAAYDHRRALVIDPVLVYSSFLGGSQQNSLSRIAIDSAGNAYVVGFTASGDFPASPTPQATTFGGGSAQRGVFVAKIDPIGSTLLYSTYLSGSAGEQATGLSLDASGNAYVTGNTTSADFPVRNAFQSTCGTNPSTGACSNAFLTKISSTGDALLYSTYLGGTGTDSATSLAVDSAGNAYVVGTTSSLDFPATTGALQTKCGGSCTQNAFAAKFNPTGESLSYATYLGGSGSDGASDVALDSAGNAYVTGQTTSVDFPVAGAFQKTCTAASSGQAAACLGTAFLTKIKADGSALVYSTYLGGSSGSQGTGIAVDSLGSAYVTGSTQSVDFPVLKAFQGACGMDLASGKCSVDVFLSKFTPSGKALVYSTYLGGSGRDEASGIALDAAGNAHIVGRTESADFPTAKPLQAKLNGASDAFVAKFNAAGSALLFSTYHGGSATEAGNGIALDSKGNIYVAGETSSPDFPTLHPFQSSCAGACNSAFISKMTAPPPANQAPTITSANNVTFTVGTLGTFTVTTTGTPTPAISDGGATLPSGVTFTDNGDGTGTLTGTAASGTGGTYSFTFTASNGVLPNATQSFTLNVDEAPTISGATSLTCTVGTACSTLMSTTGFPTPTLSETGAEPSGITFTDNGNGTGTLGGTPAVGSGGIYTAVVINASNAAGAAPPHPVNPVTINEAPAILSANNATFTVGTLGTFTVTTRGFPKPTLSDGGATLPTGVTFVDNGNGTGTLSGTPAANTGGTYPITFTATNTVSTANQTFTLTVDQAPAITSANHTTFTVGSAGTFTVTTTGFPKPGIVQSGATLPSGVTFVDNGNGTGTLSGTPAAGTGGTYSLTFTVSNGVLPNAAQTFTLTVDQAPAITSAASTIFKVGSAGTFTVTTTGFPKPAIVQSGATLPSGVTFVDNGNGTGTLSGTPALGTNGTYLITFTASNGILPNATQSFTLTVDLPPVITSTASTTFTVGTAGTFTVTTTGSPVPSLTQGGVALPGGVTFVDNGNGTGTLSGTPAVSTGGTYAITFTATNRAGSATQNFTLTIDEAPAIISGSSTTFTVGIAGSFTVTTRGFPKPSLTQTGATLPSGVTFADNGNGTGTLSGTPGAGTGGIYSITFNANNGIGTPAAQPFTLTVNQPPAFTSTASTNCQVLAGPLSTIPCSFTVTTTGFPIPAISETATLPSGITFVDNGNRTGTLSGTPAEGTGGIDTLSFKATNAAGTATQTFALTIADFMAALSGQIPVVIIQGGSGPATLTLTPQNGYAGTITPSCPPGSGCSFIPTSVTLPSASNTSVVTVSTTATTPVGTYSVNVTSTDTNGDFHAVALPYDVECTFALNATTLTPPAAAGGSYSFGFTVTETQGGTACPWVVALSSGSGIAITSPAAVGGSNAGMNTQAVVSQSSSTYQGPSAVTQGNLAVSYFAAPPATGVLNFAVVQEPVTTIQTAVIAGGSTQVTLPVSATAWSNGSFISYLGTPVCSVLGPNGSLDPQNANFGITCSASATPTPLPPTPPAPQLTIQTSASTVAFLRPQRDRQPLPLLYAFTLGIPAIVFLGIGGLFPGWKRFGQSRLLKMLGLLVLISLLAILPGCGGGIKATITPIGNNNNFTVTVVGTVVDITGAVEGVEVQTVSLPVSAQI
jgi:hypothetical protein